MQLGDVYSDGESKYEVPAPLYLQAGWEMKGVVNFLPSHIFNQLSQHVPLPVLGLDRIGDRIVFALYKQLEPESWLFPKDSLPIPIPFKTLLERRVHVSDTADSDVSYAAD